MAKSKFDPNATKRIDEYIESSADFAKSICLKLREIIHKADPEIIEDWKWGPNFNKAGMICGFGAFKKHVNFFFFKGSLMSDADKIFSEGEANKNTRGMKFSSVDEVNERILIKYLKEAVKLNISGAKPVEKQITIADDFKSALRKNKLLEPFEKMAFTHRKEYIQWIDDAKKLETRERRLQKAITMISEGKKFS